MPNKVATVICTEQAIERYVFISPDDHSSVFYCLSRKSFAVATANQCAQADGTEGENPFRQRWVVLSCRGD